MVFKRDCERCGLNYQPSGKQGRYCNECRWIKVRNNKKKKTGKPYWERFEELEHAIKELKRKDIPCRGHTYHE